MPDDFLEHTEDAGEKAVGRTEELLNRIASTMGTMAEHLGALTEHVTHLEAQKAVEQVPEAARDAVNDTIDTAGPGGSVVTKAVDVPIAVSEDVIHDSGETVKEASQDVKAAKRKLFKRKGGR